MARLAGALSVLLAVAAHMHVAEGGDPPPWYHPGVPWWVNPESEGLPKEAPELFVTPPHQTHPAPPSGPALQRMYAPPPHVESPKPMDGPQQDHNMDAIFDRVVNAKNGNVPAGKQADVGPILEHVTDPTLENVLAAKGADPAFLETGRRAQGPHSLAMLRGRNAQRRDRV